MRSSAIARRSMIGDTPGLARANDVESSDVVRRAQAGDVAAFESLYRAHSPAIFALCRRMAGDESEAKELLQDAFVRAWERLPSFRGESAIGTWLHRLAVNVVLGRFRDDRRREHVPLNDELPVAHIDGAVGAEDRIDLNTAIARLPAGARSVLVLHDVYGYSHDEIAEMTGIAAGTARAQLWRARRALLSLLSP